MYKYVYILLVRFMNSCHYSENKNFLLYVFSCLSPFLLFSCNNYKFCHTTFFGYFSFISFSFPHSFISTFQYTNVLYLHVCYAIFFCFELSSRQYIPLELPLIISLIMFLDFKYPYMSIR